MKKYFKTSLIAGLLIFVLSVIFSFYQIRKDVKQACLKAKDLYQQNCVDSLIAFAKSDDNSFREKNSAIWALGQIADKSALPFLNGLKNSLQGQKRCNSSKYLCRYEIEKAVRWCEEGNVTSWMYRNRENWK